MSMQELESGTEIVIEWNLLDFSPIYLVETALSHLHNAGEYEGALVLPDVTSASPVEHLKCARACLAAALQKIDEEIQGDE